MISTAFLPFHILEEDHPPLAPAYQGTPAVGVGSPAVGVGSLAVGVGSPAGVDIPAVGVDIPAGW